MLLMKMALLKMKLDFNSQGLLISIIILILLILICHISNYLYTKHKKPSKKNNFMNLNLSIPNTPIPTQFNQIYYKEIFQKKPHSFRRE
jgi:hypothetical protein